MDLKMQFLEEVFFVCVFFFGGEEGYAQQGRARIRRPRPDWAARPAL
jgi:hypothetical protein